MNQAARLDERVLRRRKALVTGMVLLTALVFLGFIFASWNFLRNMESYLEEELGVRLSSVALLSAEIIQSGNFAGFLASGQASLVRPELARILNEVRAENQLQGAYLVNSRYEVIASSHQVFAAGERLTFLEEDSTEFAQAAAGAVTVARTRIIGDQRFKSAYAPVQGPLGDVVAILAVQASADFFQLLETFKGGLILTTVVGVVLTVLFSTVLFWAISVLIKTHESLRQSERLAAMGEMAATVAHEIRNPLGIIKSTADVLQSKYDSDEQPDELFQYIPSEVRRLNRLISDFLTFARDRDLQLQASDLGATIERSLESLQEEIQQRRVNLEKSLETLPPVPHDEDAINQVLLNLTLNAVQAMNGEGRVSVRLQAAERKGRAYARLEVEDTGSGIDGDVQKIFEPFYTTKASGSGLGLAICKRLIEKHGGWIEVESQKGQGTRIRFYLPIPAA